MKKQITVALGKMRSNFLSKSNWQVAKIWNEAWKLGDIDNLIMLNIIVAITSYWTISGC